MYTVYKTTNLINQRFYIGVHKTTNVNDAYFGSGVVLKLALLKYGKANFKKEVLFIFSDATNAFSKETELVSDALADPLCMNIKRGGLGGFEFINEHGLNDRTGETRTEEQRQRIGEGVHRSSTPERRTQQAERMKGRQIGLGNQGRRTSPSPEHREKISQAMKSASHIYEEVTCPVCGKAGAKNAMKRWHFDNCKTKRV